MSDDLDVAAVELLERELQTPAARADRERLLQLLAPTFTEIGASGLRWDLASILEMLAEESAGTDQLPQIEVTNLEGRVITPGVVQVLWDSRQGGRRARRSSLWCHTNGRWQQVFHQGTLLP